MHSCKTVSQHRPRHAAALKFPQRPVRRAQALQQACPTQFVTVLQCIAVSSDMPHAKQSEMSAIGGGGAASKCILPQTRWQRLPKPAQQQCVVANKQQRHRVIWTFPCAGSTPMLTVSVSSAW